jgi:hypothetical protein
MMSGPRYYKEGKYQYNATFDLIYVTWDKPWELEPRRVEIELAAPCYGNSHRQDHKPYEKEKV